MPRPAGITTATSSTTWPAWQPTPIDETLTPPTPGSSVGSELQTFDEQVIVHTWPSTPSTPLSYASSSMDSMVALFVEPQAEPEPAGCLAMLPLQPQLQLETVAPPAVVQSYFFNCAVADVPPPPPRFWLCHTNGRPPHIIRLTESVVGTREVQMISNHHGRRQLTDDHGQWEHLGDNNEWIHLQYRYFSVNSLLQCVEVFAIRDPRAQNVWVEYTQDLRQGLRVYLDRSLATPQDESVFIEHVWQSIM